MPEPKNFRLTWANPPHALLIQTQPCADLAGFLTTYFTNILAVHGVDDPVTRQKIADRTYHDWITLNGAERVIRKADIVAMAEQFQTYTSERAGIRFGVIQAFERANDAAANAFLRFLEEPSPRTYFVLTTGEIGQLPPTIVSRCQRITLPTARDALTATTAPLAPAFPTLTALQEFLASPVFPILTGLRTAFVEHTDFLGTLEGFKKLDYSQITIFFLMLRGDGTPDFRSRVVELLPTLTINPTKSLLFFTIWEA